MRRQDIVVVAVDDGTAPVPANFSKFGRERFGRDTANVLDVMLGFWDGARGWDKDPFIAEDTETTVVVPRNENAGSAQIIGVRSHRNIGKVEALALGLAQLPEAVELVVMMDDDVAIESQVALARLSQQLDDSPSAQSLGAVSTHLSFDWFDFHTPYDVADVATVSVKERRLLVSVANRVLHQMLAATQQLADIGRLPWVPGGFAMYKRDALIDTFGELQHDSPPTGEDWKLSSLLINRGFETRRDFETRVMTAVPPTWQRLHGQLVRWYRDLSQNLPSIVASAKIAGVEHACAELITLNKALERSPIGDAARDEMKRGTKPHFEQREIAIEAWDANIDRSYRRALIRLVRQLSVPELVEPLAAYRNAALTSDAVVDPADLLLEFKPAFTREL